MSAKKNLLRRLAAVYIAYAKSGGASTTVTAAAAAGDLTFTVVDATGLAANQSIQIDDGENIERGEIAGVAGSVITLVKPLLRNHADGFAVVEQTVYDTGDVENNVTATQTTEQSDVISAMRRLKFQTTQGYQQAPVESLMLGQTPENLAFALGIPQSSVIGTGASISAPKTLTTDFSDVDSVDNVCFILKYITQDGSTRTREFWGCAIDYSGYAVAMTLGQTGSIPIKFAVYGAIAEGKYSPTFVANTTKKAAKGKVFDKLDAVGTWNAGGGDTTVATDAAARATTLVLADASGIAGGDWIGVNTGDLFETHLVTSKAVNTLTLATPLFRAQATGVAVQKVTMNEFAAVGKDGVKLNVGGTTTPIQSGLRRLPLGMQAGNVDATMQLSLMERTSPAFAYARGIPQANIDTANSDRVLLSENLATASVLAAFVKGTLKDGTVCWVNIWAPAQDVASIAEQFGSDPNAATSPFNVKPSSGVQFVQYAA